MDEDQFNKWMEHFVSVLNRLEDNEIVSNPQHSWIHIGVLSNTEIISAIKAHKKNKVWQYLNRAFYAARNCSKHLKGWHEKVKAFHKNEKKNKIITKFPKKGYIMEKAFNSVNSDFIWRALRSRGMRLRSGNEGSVMGLNTWKKHCNGIHLHNLPERPQQTWRRTIKEEYSWNALQNLNTMGHWLCWRLDLNWNLISM